MAAKLKVFVTSDGLADYVVAASSRPKALAAWEAHQDLFANGAAHETDDPELMKAALAQPGEVLRRPAKSNARPAALPHTVKTKGPSKAALRQIEKAETRLAGVEAEHDEAIAEMAAQRAALDAREAAETEHYEDARRAAERDLAKARRAL
ncbi:hypothetical protein JKL49_09325 [Phenylobacterium sp. 20VBR1]|uniref:Cell envelope biogenesis protein TolA n=1 Tax=Phenylobacterium glaciei TaxID=2803784 RepID=A0A941D0B7_9CAUL|nr:hypothetical protein [Phenylobacterium glaciei]MBR7619587.1 hypothetical protein [Phenylobacterium glaciei]QQZ48663.1 hypothetical protein JKL49_14185 [Phenylobacterium glaciei]